MDEKFEVFCKHIDELTIEVLEEEIPVHFFESIVWNMLQNKDVDVDMLKCVCGVLELFYKGWKLHGERFKLDEEDSDEIELFN